MSNRVALLILFNHNYTANLDRLGELYKNRFSKIFYIMPFYTGDRKDVITVYENSYYFQGYIATAIQQIKHLDFDHYFIIGDDLILNPDINETNYDTYFKVNKTTGFVPGFFYLNDVSETRPFRRHAPYWENNERIFNFNIKPLGIEVEKFIPSYEEAVKRLEKHGLHFTPDIPMQMFYRKPLFVNPFKNKPSFNAHNAKLYVQSLTKRTSERKLAYPMVGSYSDCIIIPKDYVEAAIRYCAIFAALHLFVEVALPTALALSLPNITQEKDLVLKGATYWHKEIEVLEKAYNNSLDNLLNSFPKDALYIHPIKLSKWK